MSSSPALPRSSSPAAPASKASAASRSAWGASSAWTRRAWKLASAIGVVAVSLPLCGCYLGHVASGQLQLLWSSRSIEEALGDPGVPGDERAALARVDAVLAYAAQLGLETQGQYRRYVDWPGDRIVTTLVATRPGEVEAAGFWFPIVGRVPYKGYFDPARAGAAAEDLRDDGLDVCEVSVRAYSTLGWFDDPVTGPMLRQPEGDLVETLLHELVHATVFLASQPEFNEGVATFIGAEARVRFYVATEGAAAAGEERRRVEARQRFRAERLALRDAIAALYAETAPGPARDARRSALEADLRARLGQEGTLSPESVERLRLNDACLALAGTYGSDHACLVEAFAREGNDLPRFIDALRRAAEADDPRATLLGDDCAVPQPSGSTGTSNAS